MTSSKEVRAEALGVNIREAQENKLSFLTKGKHWCIPPNQDFAL
jgi:hypothetical protein